MIIQWPLLLHPLQKHFEGTEDIDDVPLGTFYWAISKNKIKKIWADFFVFFKNLKNLNFFFSSSGRPLLLHPLLELLEGR